MKLLIIEDDLDINHNIQEALLAESYLVDAAYDGMMGEKLLMRNRYDCVILDINLPHKNGYDICRLMRGNGMTTPVLLLTAFDELEDKIQGFDVGADDYLTKPFYMKELLIRIKSLIKRSSQPVTGGTQSEKLHFKNIFIDTKNATVKKNGEAVHLTPREYQILRVLVEAKGELVSKKELIREIWGTLFDANTNTIEVYINFLRNKMDKPFGDHLIKTKVGYGYYLD